MIFSFCQTFSKFLLVFSLNTLELVSNKFSTKIFQISTELRLEKKLINNNILYHTIEVGSSGKVA